MDFVAWESGDNVLASKKLKGAYSEYLDHTHSVSYLLILIKLASYWSETIFQYKFFIFYVHISDQSSSIGYEV